MEYKKVNKIVIVLILIIIILLIIISLFVGYCLFNKDSNNSSEIELDEVRISTDVYDLSSAEQRKVQDRRIFYSGIPDSEIKKGIAIQLRNPEENIDIYIQYKIEDEAGKLIHKTDLIIPGKYSIWVPTEELDVGKHTVSVVQQPFIKVDNKWVKLLPATNNVSITIIE